MLKGLLEAFTEAWSVFQDLKFTNTFREIEWNLGGKIRMRFCLSSSLNCMHLNMCFAQFDHLNHRSLGSSSYVVLRSLLVW